ncbi:hypothetical protein C4K05_6265 [Pseudomonas chlororaphis subsp. aureofaciens]|uniref:Uncharacterized protein n=1 Tax=Pseudomonas chlororaphis subsp. aureofaciens TaxID=587851 RepID=A0AAD1E9B5_9PSED|nr:hypothetical protein [Pseudomonas chlororaphis]AZE32916.1 hypothetical protein C4K07_6176 [Pseudomonas chlororaphis subsp. aureofaciens]AZE39222.1 hypothetical protein C4K06_6234 [Pseudomonas chlororaphis subsp. aureofaciens]AZE45560.1 hypothetical protein C4K05_6265 [Pseudomonas chlororaphis subsp. aureofaciens]
MKYNKCSSVVLAFLFFVLFVRSAIAEGQQCQINIQIISLESASCQKESGVNIVKLVSTHISPYATDLEKLPTFIMSGGDREDLIRRVGISIEATSPYNRLIELPYPEKVIDFSNVPKSAELKIAQKGWRLLDMKSVVYGGSEEEEGAGLVCITLEKEIRGEVVVVSQCNSFYESDISRLKEILESIDD